MKCSCNSGTKFVQSDHKLKVVDENVAMEVSKLFAQASHQVDNDIFVKVKKLIQDLIWKLQSRFLSLCDTELSTTNCSETSLQEEVSNANYIHNEETTTNDELGRITFDFIQ